MMSRRRSGLVTAIERFFTEMGSDLVEERVTRFILQQIHAGESLDEALAEPYVVNNTTVEWRRQLLEHPEVVRAVEEEVGKSFRTGRGESGR